MGVAPVILEITKENVQRLSEFIDTLGKERETFRYFDKRSTDVIENHVFTCLVLSDGEPAGYGHLDLEAGVVWLGIAVREKFQGKGLGKKLMDVLLQRGEELGLDAIQLSVDLSNERAIRLYEGYGFKEVKKQETYTLLRKDL